MAFQRIGHRTAAERVGKPLVPAGARPRLGASPPGAAATPPTFNGNVNNLWEAVGEEQEVSGMGAGLEGTRTTRTWQCTPAGFEDLTSAFSLILGSCAYGIPGGQPRLNRTLPLADPVSPWAYASGVSSVKGFGRGTLTAADGTLEAAPFPYSTLWTAYGIEVESMSRPFPIKPDWSIQVMDGSWFPETSVDSNPPGTTSVGFSYADEQNRFCTATFTPAANYVEMKNAALRGYSSQLPGSTPPGPGSGATAAQITAGPRLLLPDAKYVVKWFYVPYRYVLSSKSYLERWRGRINQNPMTGPDGFVFPPGSLLYDNYTPEVFTPPVNAIVPLNSTGTTGMNTVSTEKFCNITMSFLYTKRNLTGTVPADPANQNYILANHNLLPWWNAGFGYFAFLNPLAPNPPIYLSAPLETLWADPEAYNGVP